MSMDFFLASAVPANAKPIPPPGTRMLTVPVAMSAPLIFNIHAEDSTCIPDEPTPV